jgi:hypothetical protein
MSHRKDVTRLTACIAKTSGAAGSICRGPVAHAAKAFGLPVHRAQQLVGNEFDHR